MSTFTIEGTWSGYRSEQRRIAHRSLTRDEKFAKAVVDLDYIVYSDGTTLDLAVKNGKVKGARYGDAYGELIRRCVEQGTRYVDKLEPDTGGHVELTENERQRVLALHPHATDISMGWFVVRFKLNGFDCYMRRKF